MFFKVVSALFFFKRWEASSLDGKHPHFIWSMKTPWILIPRRPPNQSTAPRPKSRHLFIDMREFGDNRKMVSINHGEYEHIWNM